MNMRKRKLVVMAAMYYIAANARLFRKIEDLFRPTPAQIVARNKRHEAEWAGLVSTLVEPIADPVPAIVAPKTYRVARVKDSVVVLETQDLAEAEETILKAARQKKAKLHILSEDHPYIFDDYDAKNFVHMV